MVLLINKYICIDICIYNTRVSNKQNKKKIQLGNMYEHNTGQVLFND